MSDSTRHVLNKYQNINGTFLHLGSVYYLDANEEFHRSDGPAVVNSRKHQAWYYHGHFLCDYIEGHGTYVAKGLTKEQQEFLIGLRPDLIGNIGDLRRGLRAKYQHELELAGVDI